MDKMPSPQDRLIVELLEVPPLLPPPQLPAYLLLMNPLL